MVVNKSCYLNADRQWERAGYFALQDGLIEKMKQDTLLRQS